MQPKPNYFWLFLAVSFKRLLGIVASHDVLFWNQELQVKEHSKIKGIISNESEMNVPGNQEIKDTTSNVYRNRVPRIYKLSSKDSLSSNFLENHTLLYAKTNMTHSASSKVGNISDNRVSQVVVSSPYELTTGFTKRKLLAAPSPGMEKAAKDVPEASTKKSENLKEANRVLAKKKSGPNEYISSWPSLRQQMLALKKKVSSARNQLDAPGNLILERIDEGDELKRRASTVSNVQRLDHLGKTPNAKLVTALKKTYKDLDDGINGVSQRLNKIKKSAPAANVDAEVRKFEKELRKRMQFVTPSVDAAIQTAWTSMTDSLADTTNFQYSALRDMPPLPVFSIYRFGDGAGEKTTLKDDLKNMQTSIDSLSRESIEPMDPDLQRVDKVLKDLLTRTQLSKAISTADTVVHSNIKEKSKLAFDPHDLYFGVDHHQDADVDDETSTIKDGVFYLFDSRNRPVVPNVQSDLSKNFDAGAIADHTVGGGSGLHEFSGHPPPERYNLRNLRSTRASRPHGKRQKNKVRHNRNTITKTGMMTVAKYPLRNVERHLYRKRRAADVPRKKQVSKGSVLYDDEKDGIRLDIHSIKKKLDMGGNKAPKRPKIKSNEDTQSYNKVDMEALTNEKASWKKGLPPYKMEEEVDETGDLGYELPFGRKYLVYEHIDRVPDKASGAETVEKDSDNEFEDESMETGTLINNNKLDDMSIKRDKNLLNAYKKTAGLRLFPPEMRQGSNPKFGRINDGLASDFRLGPGESVDDTDIPIFGPDRNYPATGPNAGSEVGSLSYWTKEMRKLDESDKRNAILAAKLEKDMFSDADPPGDGDFLYLDTGGDVRRKSAPRVSDLFADQVKNIIQDTKEGQDHIVRSGRKQLPPWRHDLDFDVAVSEDKEHVRRKEDELVRLINPSLDVMVRRQENAEADNWDQRPGANELAKVDKIVLGLLDDAPVNPDEFDYLKELADVSVFNKPIQSNPANLDDALPPDKITKTALDSLDRASNTLQLIDQDMRYRHKEHLKDELAEVEKLKRKVKLDKETVKMDKMYADLKAIPKLQAMDGDLRNRRMKQYTHIKDVLENAYNKRLSKQKQNYKAYMQLFKEMKKNQKELDRMAAIP